MSKLQNLKLVNRVSSRILAKDPPIVGTDITATTSRAPSKLPPPPSSSVSNNYNGKELRSSTPAPTPPLTISKISIEEQIKNFNWPLPDFRKPNYLWNASSTITIFLVGLWSKSVLRIMNKTKILNKERMTNAILNRPEGTPLVTVSNHESCIDDPTLIAAFMTNRQLASHKNMRWSLAAYDICYRTKLESTIFSLGKCVPCIRGLGVYQRAVDFVIERLNEGDWIHIFPEGRVNLEREGLYRLKWGIGRILSDCKRTPIVIPFWHTGMDKVLPNYPPYFPRWGNEVVINVGKPFDLTDVLECIEGKSSLERRKIVTDFIQVEMMNLREETLEITSKMK